MSNKNPFELRTEILTMAKEYMDRQMEMNRDFAQRAFEDAIASGTATAESWKSFVPTMYTVEELMKKATEMYSFISTSK